MRREWISHSNPPLVGKRDRRVEVTCVGLPGEVEGGHILLEHQTSSICFDVQYSLCICSLSPARLSFPAPLRHLTPVSCLSGLFFFFATCIIVGSALTTELPGVSQLKFLRNSRAL